MVDSGGESLLGYYGEWVEVNSRNDAESNFPLTTLFKLIANAMYPVGSIYMSVKDVNPSVLFGGTWVRIEDKFLLSSGSSYPITYDSNDEANRTGGEASHTLTVDEIPSHNHGLGTEWSDGSGSNGAYTYSANRKLKSKTTENTGGGQAHNNMPPYLVVNVWKRTA